MTQAQIVAVANHKGGVGKTTTAIGMARAAAERGERALVVDNDGQGNATIALTDFVSIETTTTPTMADVYDRDSDVDFTATIVPTSIERLDVAVSGFENFDPVIQALTTGASLTPHTALSKALRTVRSSYDWIIIDCPPTRGYPTINALYAAGRAVVVCEPHSFAHHGLSKITDLVDDINEEVRPDNQLTSPTVLINALDTRSTKIEAGVVGEIKRWCQESGLVVFGQSIPRRAAIKSVSQRGAPLTSSPEAAVRDIAGVYGDLLDSL